MHILSVWIALLIIPDWIHSKHWNNNGWEDNGSPVRSLKVNILISALSLHVFKGWAVCVERRGNARELVDRELLWTQTRELCHTDVQSSALFIVCTC